MSSAIVRALNIACDVISVLDDIDKASQADAQHQEEAGIINKISLINRLILLGFSSAEAGMVVRGSSPASLRTLKSFEIFPRVGQLCIQIPAEAVNTPDDEPRLKTISRIFRKGLIGPIADLTRVGAELASYSEQDFLAKFEEDPKATRPVYKQDSDGDFVQIGERPIDPDECKKAINQAQGVSGAATVVRAVAAMPIEDSAVPVYELLERFMRRVVAHFAEAPAAQAPGGQEEDERIDWTNLMALESIPPPLQNDAVFQRYICPITQLPIRHPVRDPNGITLYERRAIEAYLGEGVRPSPITRRNMSRHDLQDASGIQAIIDARLHQHQEQFVQFVQERARAPI